MNTNNYDVIVMGGGPAGSSVASMLAREGRQVILFEKEIFPRHHIGESLMTDTYWTFRRMGLLDKLKARPFVRKYSVQFANSAGKESRPFYFFESVHHESAVTWQVTRAKFDHILLKNARSKGVDVREGWTVTCFSESDSEAKIEATSPEGTKHAFTGKFLIDASGRGNMTGNQEGLRVVHPHLKKLAVFGHFRNVQLDVGREGGDTIITRLENKWFWIIPVSSEKTSVGCVMDQSEFASRKETPQQIFDSFWKSSPILRKRMEGAELVGPIQVTSDFSYQNQRYVGKRLMRVGDAAGFMDPIFSAGVFLALVSRKPPRKTDRQRIRIQELIKRNEISLRQSLSLQQ